jgi:hypothetical protein
MSREMYGKSLEMRYFSVFPCRRRTSRAPSRAAEAAKDGKDERNGSTGGGRVYSQYRPGWQNGILAEVAGFRSNPPAKYFLKG